jgi:hypothetical protein
MAHFQLNAIYLRNELTLTIPGCFIAPDLPGEDQPETVGALMREIFEWAGLEAG